MKKLNQPSYSWCRINKKMLNGHAAVGVQSAAKDLHQPQEPRTIFLFLAGCPPTFTGDVSDGFVCGFVALAVLLHKKL